VQIRARPRSIYQTLLALPAHRSPLLRPSLYHPPHSAAGTPLELHDRKVNSLSLEPLHGRLLASSATDYNVCIWDVRKLGKGCKPLETLEHNKSCQSAYFAPDGSQRLLVTCYDDTVRVYSPGEGAAAGKGQGGKKGGAAEAEGIPKSFHSSSVFKHDNQTGRWVIPFRAIWGARADCAIIGSMKRGIDVLPIPATGGSAGAGASARLTSELQTAISSRHAVHPELPLLAAATGSGRCHVYHA
jgi:WD repeat-containing protein 76